MRPPLYQLSYAATGREAEEILAGRGTLQFHCIIKKRAERVKPLESSRNESCWMGLTIPLGGPKITS